MLNSNPDKILLPSTIYLEMSPVANGIPKEEEEIDYSDIEKRCSIVILLRLHNTKTSE